MLKSGMFSVFFAFHFIRSRSFVTAGVSKPPLWVLDFGYSTHSSLASVLACITGSGLFLTKMQTLESPGADAND